MIQKIPQLEMCRQKIGSTNMRFQNILRIAEIYLQERLLNTQVFLYFLQMHFYVPKRQDEAPFQAIICDNSLNLSHIHHKSKGHSKTK